MLCGSGYHTESSLNLHICTQHEVDCELCAATFFDRYDLNVHTENVHGRGFEECENRVMNMILEECINFPHTLTTQSCHPINVPEQLPESTKGTFQRESPTTPITDHESYANVYAEHDSNPNTQIVQEHINKSQEAKQCDSCDYSLSCTSEHNIHMQQVHSTDTHSSQKQPTVSSPLVFPCPTCGITFIEIRELKLHVDSYHRPIVPNQADTDLFIADLIQQNLNLHDKFQKFHICLQEVERWSGNVGKQIPSNCPGRRF